MKIFVGYLRPDERALVVGGLKRWALHLDLTLEFTDQRKGCDLALLDADQTHCVMTLAHERVISIGRANIDGADAHLSRPIRGFQLAAAIVGIMEKQPSGSGSRSARNFLHTAAA